MESGKHKAGHRSNAQCVVGVFVVQKAVEGLANMQCGLNVCAPGGQSKDGQYQEM